MPAKKNMISISDLNLGGLSNSLWSGLKNTLYRLVGIDLHSIPGIAQARQALVKISEDTGTDAIDNFVRVFIPCSNGKGYAFASSSGKVWEVEQDGTILLVYTTTPNKGDAGCLGAREYSGYIYWATEKRLHRIAISALADWDDAQEDWQELNLDNSLVATGQTYTLTTGVNEGATHLQSFIPTKSPIEAVALNVGAVGTGNWTIKVHDSANTKVGTVTITNANMATGWYIFELTAAFYPVLGDTYHIHAYSSVADGTVVTGTTVDFETSAYKTYTDSDPYWHPMLDQNLVLYIGDQNMVHQVDGETFTKDALDIVEPYRITSFGRIMNDLLIGTYINDNVNETKVFRWNTYGDSFTSSDPIPETGINAVFSADNLVFINAGLQGNIYVYNGETLELYKKIPGDYSPTQTGFVHANAVANLGGLMLFGFSNDVGNPALQGVYILGRNCRDYPIIMDLSFPISERDGDDFVLEDLEIGSILVMGADVFVSWYNQATAGVGIDKLDYSLKLDGAYFETMVKTLEREVDQTFGKVVAAYAEMPAGTSLTLAHKLNYAADYTNMTSVVDTDRNIQTAEEGLNGTTIQLKTIFNTSVNDSPKFESAAIVPSG